MTKKINDILYDNLNKVIMFIILKILDVPDSPRYENNMYV